MALSWLRQTQVITFDCYGTLIDWEGGARRTLGEIFRGQPLPVSEEQFFAEWERRQFQLIRSYRPYREIMAESFLAACSALRLPATPNDARAFADGIARWQPFPDTRAALARLHQKWKLAIISNIDDDIIAETVKLVGVDFDWIITAQQARAYKPSLEPFRLALRRMAVPAAQVAHAAFGFEYDIGPAATLGMKTILVKRTRVEFPTEPQPDLVVRDLAELADLFEAA